MIVFSNGFHSVICGYTQLNRFWTDVLFCTSINENCLMSGVNSYINDSSRNCVFKI